MRRWGGVGLAFLLIGSFGLGVGVMNCFLLLKFPTWQRVWAILNRPLFVVSCIFFLFEGIPDQYQEFLWWNPIIHLVGHTRHAFYDAYDPEYLSAVYVFSLSLGLGALGIIFLRRYHREMIES